MKNIKLIALLVCLTVIVCSFAGCAKTAMLTFDAKGGTVSGEQPESYTNNAALALPSATLKYYKFVGWSLNSDGSNPLTELPADMELTDEQVELGMTLYAVWERLTGTITYDRAGGAFAEGDEPASSYFYGETTELLEPERQYFEFDGWTLNGEAIDEIGTEQEGNITLVATWTQVETPITFNLGGIEGAALPDADETFATDEGLTLTDAEYIPTAPGYIFAGWYTNAECTGEAITEIPEDTTEAVTVYAKWEASPVIGGDNWVGV